MSAWPTFKLHVDYVDDGVFVSGDSDAQYVKKFTSRIGMTRVGQRVADACELILTMDNHGGQGGYGIPSAVYKPESMTKGLPAVGTPYRVVATYAAVDYVIFTGRLVEAYGKPLGQDVIYVIKGRWASAGGRISLPSQINKRTDEIIEQALELGEFANQQKAVLDDFPYDLWVLDAPEHFMDGMVLGGVPLNATLEEGKSTFPYVADVFQNLSVRQIVETAVNAEVGYFYEDQQGYFRFANRHNIFLKTTPSVNFTTAVDVDYHYGRGLVNEVQFRVQPRRTVANATLWQSTKEMKYKPGMTLQTIRLLDTNGRVIGTYGDIIPTSFSFTAESSGATVRVKVLPTAKGGTVELQVFNPSNENVIMAVGATLSGTALVLDDPIDVIERKGLSIAYHGRWSDTHDLALFDEPEQAIQTAAFMLAVHAWPRGAYDWIEIQNDTAADLVNQLSLNVLDLVNVAFYQFEAANYVIIGIEHKCDFGVRGMRTRFWLERQDEGAFWILDAVGYAELDRTTRLGY